MTARLITPPEVDDGPRDRLPTLMEVLNRRTLAPVDLFSFYIYMRDQQRSVDYLDFWLDVSQHLSLCRHYVSGLRRSVLVDTPDAEKALASSRHSSQLLDSFDLIDNPAAPSSSGAGGKSIQKTRDDTIGSGDTDRDNNQRLSQFLRTTDSHSSSSGSAASRHGKGRSNGTHSRQSHYSRSSTPSATGIVPGVPLSSTTNTNSSTTSPANAVAREDIRASAEKILYTFLLAGSEREIVLPEALLASITIAIEETGRDDPEIFDAAKDYVFSAMERDAYPNFLRARALGNLVPPHLMLRLVVGLVSLFGGLWAGFTLIFLDRPRLQRCWLILPFAIGIYCLASHQYTLDPLQAMAGWSEYTIFSYTRVREPFVRKLLAKRGAVSLLWVIGIVAALSCLFIFVPGKRL